MHLPEELEAVKFVVNMCETIFLNFDKFHNDSINIGSSEFVIDKGERHFYLRKKVSTETGETFTIFSFDSSEYTNLRANNAWSLDFYPEEPDSFTSKYSVLNSFDDEDKDTEDYIDSFLTNRRIMTEDEYFQSTLIMDSMPSTYQDLLDILDVMHTRSYAVLKDVSVSFYTEDVDMKLLRQIRRTLQHRFKVDFIKEK